MKATAIVPAYNEAARITTVLEALQVDLVGQIIVVDDGSTDETGNVAQNYPVELIRLAQNQGKAQALSIGVESADFETLLFLDADLIGIKPDHVRAMLRTYWDSDADMTIGVFHNGRLNTDLSQKLNPHLSGQRVISKKIWGKISEIKADEFGVEMALTKMARKEGLTSSKVKLPGVTHVMKEEKRGLTQGLKSRLMMYGDIIKTTLSPPWTKTF